ncbi:MAG: SPOR domain-containing protein [Janthinobacterium lividum]
MARSQSSGALNFVKWAGAAAATVVGGVAIGYLFGNARVPHPTVQPVQPLVSTTLRPTPSISPSSIHPRTSNGNYTAPGAPHIVIEEESQPILRRAIPPPAPKADPEATQEATTPLRPADQPAPTDTTVTSPSNNDISAPSSGAPQTNDSSPNPTVPTPAPVPADQDFEHVNGGNKPPPTTAPDPEAGQQSGAVSPQDSGKVQFRVQTGAYTDESNARSVADTLRSQGYATSTRSERQGDHLVYKVQVGAYRSKTGASKAADDLQKKGYSAFISPMTP